MSSPSANLQHLTYAQLLGGIDDLAGTSATSQDAWTKLRDICATLEASEMAAPITSGKKWLINMVRIAGFRGALEPIEISPNPNPGVTVLHGPNGAG